MSFRDYWPITCRCNGSPCGNEKVSAVLEEYTQEYPFLNQTFLNSVLSRSLPGKLDWLESDTRATYIQQLKVRPDDWRYRNQKVEYTINTQGYRAPEWKDIDWQNSIVVYGDSCVMGVGVDDNDTIASCLERLYGRPVINMGFPGGSNEHIMYNLAQMIEVYGHPWATIVIWTMMARNIYVDEFKSISLGPWCNEERAGDMKEMDYYLAVNNNDYNIHFHSYCHALTAKSMFSGHRYNSYAFFNEPADVMRAHFLSYGTGRARDNLHPSEESLAASAQFIYDTGFL